MSRNTTARTQAQQTARDRTKTPQHTAERRRWLTSGVVLAVLALVLAGLYALYQHSTSTKPTAGSEYRVGTPGKGQPAPGFSLPATTGQTVNLADYRGKTVLLYFQEGLSCQPCWDQITDLEKAASDVKAAGVDQVLSITTDPIDLITRKTRDMGLTTPVLSDPDLAVSKAYHANEYGMMGTARDGHSFILIGPDGVIRWRADYGGAPKYTMYVPVGQLLADLKAGRA